MKLLHKVLIVLSIGLTIPFDGFSEGNFERKTINLPVPEHLKQLRNRDEFLQKLLNAGTNYSWLTISSEKDKNGGIHTRCQQLFMNIPVLNAVIIVHESNNALILVTGTFIAMDGSYITVPDLKSVSDQILQKYNVELNHSNHSNHKWIWDTDQLNAGMKLYYMMDYIPENSLQAFTGIIDHETLEVVREVNHSCYADVTGTAQTIYQGIQNISTFDNGSNFSLRCTNKGQGIITRNLNNRMDYQQITEYYDNDNHWDNSSNMQSRYAADAHFCAEQYFDFLATYFNRNSLDNNGYQLKSYLNYGTSLANAFWNGQAVVYGSGNTNTNPLTTVDIAGHEFTHGLIQKTANLNYSDEPGTINESLADIFGVTMDHLMNPQQANWLVGEQSGATLRSMINPNAFNQPSCYHGNNWYYGSNDNGGVHINSGFINRWYYLVVNGGNGTNEFGTSYNFTGTGLEPAIDIVYHTLTGYLVPTSDFESFRQFTLQSAIDLYGPCSPEYTSVKNAWNAVGFGFQAGPLTLNVSGNKEICTGDNLILQVEHIPGTTYQWFHDGNAISAATGNSLIATQEGDWSVQATRCGNVILSNVVNLQYFAVVPVTAIHAETCLGTPVQLSGFPAGGLFNITNPYSGPSTSYQYTYTDQNGCSYMASATVTVNQLPQVQFVTPNSNIPVNSGTILLQSNMQGLFSGVGVSGNYFDPSVAGVGGPYEIHTTYVDNHGCTGTDMVEIKVLPPCIRQTEHLSIQTNSNGNNIISLSVNASPDDFEFQWQLPAGFSPLSSNNQNNLDVSWNGAQGNVQLLLINTCNDSMLLSSFMEAAASTPETKVNVYPNPANSGTDINIDLIGFDSSKEIKITITDISGKVISGKSSFDHFEKINGQNFSPGIYMVEIRQGTTLKNSKLVIY